MDQLAGLTEEARKLALDRFRLLRPHLEDDSPLKLVAAEAEIPFRTAQRWVALYRKLGLAALARKNRADRGERRAVSVKIKEAIEGLALQRPPLPTTAICRQARRMAQDLGAAELLGCLSHRLQFAHRSCHARPRRHESVQQHI